MGIGWATDGACPFSWGFCQHKRSMARHMGKAQWAHLFWFWALFFQLDGTLWGQSSPWVDSALHRYEQTYPYSTQEDKDSISALLRQWKSQPAYINLWPREALERIPFLSPSSAFLLARYLAEEGALIDVAEWEAMALDATERQCFEHFFAVGYPQLGTASAPKTIWLGAQYHSDGFQPWVQWRDILWKNWEKVGWETGRAQWETTRAPWLTWRQPRYQMGFHPQRGGYLRGAFPWTRRQGAKSWHLGAWYVDNQGGLCLFYLRPRWQMHSAFSTSADVGLHVKHLWPSGANVEGTFAFMPHAPARVWTPWRKPEGIRGAFPFQRGWLLLSADEDDGTWHYQGKWMSFGVARKATAIRYESVAQLGKGWTGYTYFQWAKNGAQSAVLRWEGNVREGTLSTAFGFHQQGHDPWATRSPIPMSKQGGYTLLQWRGSFPHAHGLQHIFARFTIEPDGATISGSYAFQFFQKPG